MEQRAVTIILIILFLIIVLALFFDFILSSGMQTTNGNINDLQDTVDNLNYNDTTNTFIMQNLNVVSNLAVGTKGGNTATSIMNNTLKTTYYELPDTEYDQCTLLGNNYIGSTYGGVKTGTSIAVAAGTTSIYTATIPSGTYMMIAVLYQVNIAITDTPFILSLLSNSKTYVNSTMPDSNGNINIQVVGYFSFNQANSISLNINIPLTTNGNGNIQIIRLA